MPHTDYTSRRLGSVDEQGRHPAVPRAESYPANSGCRGAPLTRLAR